MLHGVTYNVFLGNTFESLFTWLFTKNFLQDFYCFQEFPKEKIPDLKKHLNMQDFEFIFAPGWKWREKTYGELTLFKRNKLKLVQTKTISLGGKGELDFVFLRHGTKIDAALARTHINKTALLTQFLCKNKEFVLANTHLFSDILNTRRVKQVQSLLEIMKPSHNAIILGDFNYPHNKGLLQLMESNDFVSVLNKTPTFRLLPGIYWQNDYIFQKNCQITNIVVKKIHFSDHYPIFFDLMV